MCVSDSLDHDGDVLVQVATVELYQIYKNVEKVGGQTYVHPQEDKACFETRQNSTEIILLNIHAANAL